MMSLGVDQTGFLPREWSKSRSTTFRSSPWINRLNEILREELAATEIYRVLTSFRADHKLAFAASFTDEHFQASRQIAMMIIAQRGVPADKPATVMAGFNKTMLQLCSLMPGDINSRFSCTRLSAVEKHFCLTYASLAAAGPASEADVLDQLGTRAAERALMLRQILDRSSL